MDAAFSGGGGGVSGFLDFGEGRWASAETRYILRHMTFCFSLRDEASERGQETAVSSGRKTQRAEK